jgi:hypothetical protein
MKRIMRCQGRFIDAYSLQAEPLDKHMGFEEAYSLLQGEEIRD